MKRDKFVVAVKNQNVWKCTVNVSLKNYFVHHNAHVKAVQIRNWTHKNFYSFENNWI